LSQTRKMVSAFSAGQMGRNTKASGPTTPSTASGI
jgi:hypothetical protein